jgi:hypothetical protein
VLIEFPIAGDVVPVAIFNTLIVWLSETAAPLADWLSMSTAAKVQEDEGTVQVPLKVPDARSPPANI